MSIIPAGVTQGLTQGFQKGSRLGMEARNQSERLGLAQQKEQRQQEAHELDLEATQRDLFKDKAGQLYGALAQGNEEMAGRIVQQNPGMVRSAFGLPEGREPIGVSQIDDEGNYSLLIEDQQTGTAGPMTPDGGPSVPGGQTVKFGPESVRQYAGLEPDESEAYRQAQELQEFGVPAQQAARQAYGLETPEQWQPVEDDKGNVIGQRNVVTGEYQEAPEAMLPDYTSGGGDTPADVRTAQWLMEEGVAQNPSEAWNRIQSSTRQPREEAVLDLARSLAESDGSFSDKTMEDYIKEAEPIVDRLYSKSPGNGSPRGGGSPARGLPMTPTSRAASQAQGEFIAGYGLTPGGWPNFPQSGAQGGSQGQQPSQQGESTSAMGAQRSSREASPAEGGEPPRRRAYVDPSILPENAQRQLREGEITTFSNGRSFTIENGRVVEVE